MTTQNSRHTEAGTSLHWSLEAWGGETAEQIARSLTSTEADAHHRSPVEALRAEFDEIAAAIPELELREEDPETFGAGHLVFYKVCGGARLAFTEITDRPSDDPSAPSPAMNGAPTSGERTARDTSPPPEAQAWTRSTPSLPPPGHGRRPVNRPDFRS